MNSSVANSKWKLICGVEVVEKLTVLWCLSTNNDLFWLHPLKEDLRVRIDFFISILEHLQQKIFMNGHLNWLDC